MSLPISTSAFFGPGLHHFLHQNLPLECIASYLLKDCFLRLKDTMHVEPLAWEPVTWSYSTMCRAASSPSVMGLLITFTFSVATGKLVDFILLAFPGVQVRFLQALVTHLSNGTLMSVHRVHCFGLIGSTYSNCLATGNIVTTEICPRLFTL